MVQEHIRNTIIYGVTKLTGNILKPPNAVEAWDDYTEANGIFLPEKPKKVLWSGEYQISK